MFEPHRRPRKGERYVVERAFEVIVLTQWNAPFTGGEKELLPIGLNFVFDSDPPPHATSAYAVPDPYTDWEHKLVKQKDWGAKDYGGYCLVIGFDQLAANCRSLLK